MAQRNPSTYQLIHLVKLLSNGMNSLLISDGVGVGKTVSAGYIIHYVNQIIGRPVIVLCPPILEDKWRMDLKLRFDLESYSAKHDEDFSLMLEEISGKKENSKIYLLPYSMAHRRKIPSNFDVGLVVMDEIHNARNPSTNLYKALSLYCKSADYRIGLSATPIQNSIDDLASSLSLLNPIADFLIWRLFVDELWRRKKLALLSPFVTKFTKDRLKLNFTNRNVHRIEVEYSTSYVRNVERILDQIGESRGRKLTSFEKTTYLRLSSSSPNAFYNAVNRELPEHQSNNKIDKLVELIEAQEPGRWIIFTEFSKTSELIIERLSNYEISLISGASSFSERYLAFDDFRNNPHSILVMMPVGSEGLDLQVCSRLVNFDLHWNPMVLEQRIGRIDRLGQNKSEIDVYNFIVRGSVDEHMMTVLKSKIDIVEDTFASTDQVISDNTRPFNIYEHIPSSKPDDELDNYIQGQKYYSHLPIEDYQLSESIDESSCKCEDWNQHKENWLYQEILHSEESRMIAINYQKQILPVLNILDELRS